MHLLKNGDAIWLRNRLGVITFEESFGFTSSLNFTTNEESLIEQYIRIAKSYKNKNAAGLGSLAYEFSKGSTSVLQKNSNNRHIKIVAEAIKRPNDFWRWAKNIKSDALSKKFLANSETGFKLAGWPWDKAFSLASAFLYVSEEIQEASTFDSIENIDFPYWIAIDKHTAIGKKVLEECAESFNLNKTTLGWVQFYLESAKCNFLQPSLWWEIEKSWRIKNENLNEDKAVIIWESASDFLRSKLESQASEIKETLDQSFISYKSTSENQSRLI